MGAVSGHYTATYDGNDMGMTDSGYVWEIVDQGEVVRAEELGESELDLIFRGAEVYVEVTVQEWSAAAMTAVIWPWQTTFGHLGTTGTGNIGFMAVRNSFAKTLVLTAVSGSPADTDGPSTITFHRVICTEETAKRINLDNKKRLVPIRFKVFLYDDTLTKEWFDVT
jgi:hypothetical protein